MWAIPSAPPPSNTSPIFWPPGDVGLSCVHACREGSTRTSTMSDKTKRLCIGESPSSTQPRLHSSEGIFQGKCGVVRMEIPRGSRSYKGTFVVLVVVPAGLECQILVDKKVDGSQRRLIRRRQWP